MSQEQAAQGSRQGAEEFYSISNAEVQREYVQVRRASKWVPFLLPHLKSGMRLLDCGCGVGSITADLAEIVAPGQVVGIDRDASQLEIARNLATEKGITNVTFEVGDVYDLGYPDASFDAVLAHTILFHLSDRLRALREMRRVLTPGGLIAVSDDDYSTFVCSPPDSSVQQVLDLLAKYVIRNGGNPYYSRHLRGLLQEAGFAETEGHAVAADYYGTLAETGRVAKLLQMSLQTPEFVEAALTEGWTTQPQLDALVQGLGEWGDRPDAFAAVMYCAAIGWVSPRD